MKKWAFFMIALLLVTLCACAMADVEINKSNFPDSAFRKEVNTFDLDGDGILSDDEIIEATSIGCREEGIASLKGIEYFTELDWLDCSGNRLTSLDLSKNPRLAYLFCKDNKLTSLDLSNHKELYGLQCQNNKIAKLNLSNCPELNYVYCNHNGMTSLILKNNDVLQYIYGVNNNIREINVSTCEMLDWVVKHGSTKSSCSYKEWSVAAADSPFDTSVTIVLNNGVRAITSNINLKPAEIKSLKAAEGQLTVSWAKGKGIDGYEIEYSTKKNFRNSNVVTISKASTGKATLTDLKSKKNYYVRIRTFKKVKGRIYYSAWSSTKSQKTK